MIIMAMVEEPESPSLSVCLGRVTPNSHFVLIGFLLLTYKPGTKGQIIKVCYRKFYRLYPND